MVPVVPMLDEVRDLAFGVAPDFGARGFVVCERVVGIGELVEHDALAFFHQAFTHVARGFHAAFFGCEHQVRAIGGHTLTAFHGLIFGHHQDHAVAHHRRAHGERNAGVAAGGLDQRIARLDPPRSCARLIIDSAGRSLTEPAGLLPSSLARMTLVVLPGMRCKRTSGVLPMKYSSV